MNNNKNKQGGVLTLALFTLLFAISLNSCTKLIEIDPPTDTITTVEIFEDSLNAAVAINGLYSKIYYTRTGEPRFASGYITRLAGIYSDELLDVPYHFSSTLLPEQGPVGGIWRDAYENIYRMNACLEGLEGSEGITENARNMFTGEVKFIRAFFYFYLVNLYGDVPYLTTSSWKINSSAKREDQSIIYKAIIKDLEEAEKLLPGDFTYSKNKRIRATKWAAKAMLARVNLYLGNWNEAVRLSTEVIDNKILFKILSSPGTVFLANSEEAIMQFGINASLYPTYNITAEGRTFIPYYSTEVPRYIVSDSIVKLFLPTDRRRTEWLGVAKPSVNSKDYYYPTKYKEGAARATLGGVVREQYTLLRVSEQYLIRAEALVHLKQFQSALDDLNVIHQRSNTIALTTELNESEMMKAVAAERQLELFCEWGHRWFDLKRTGKADEVMTAWVPLKAPDEKWESFRKLWPIPTSEMKLNPALIPNIGYIQ